MKYVKRVDVSAQATSRPLPATDTTFATDHPALWEYLTCSQWEDGKPRLTSTLLLFVEDGLWKGCLNDRAAERSAWASGPSPEAVTAAFEAGLSGDCLEWRRRTGPNPKSGRK